jgi:hypothetical protein
MRRTLPRGGFFEAQYNIARIEIFREALMNSRNSRFKQRCPLILAISALLFCGFVRAEECPNQHSQGWCILDFMGLSKGAQDISAEDAGTVFKKAGFTPSDMDKGVGPNIIDLASAAQKFAHLGVGPLPGFSWNGMGVMFLLSGMIDERSAGQKPQFFILMSQVDVKNDNPQQTLIDAWVDGMKRFLQADFAELRQEEKNPPLGPRWISQKYLFKGGNCGDEGCIITSALFENDKTRPEELVAPSWFGGGKYYFWKKFWGPRGTSPASWRNGKVANPTDHEALANLMPKWLFRYSPGDLPILRTNEQAWLFIYPSKATGSTN